MNLLKSATFWVTLTALGIVCVLAVLGKIGGESALAAVLGLSGGYTAGKVGGGNAQK
jgi:hypothetical protein